MLDTFYLVTAAVGGTVMVCQFLLTVLGLGDGDTDFDADAAGGDVGDVDLGEIDGDHHTPLGHAADADIDHPDSAGLFQMLSFRALVAALTFFGLGGAWSRSCEHSVSQSLLIACLAGLAALYGMYRLMQAIYGLQSAGNIDIRNAIGQTATTYVPIPAAGGGKGKVQITIQERIMEYDAQTDDAQGLATGDPVLITSVLGSDLVQVRRQAVSADGASQGDS